MNKEILLRSLESKENVALFSSIKVIPESLLDSEVALKWLETSVSLRRQGSDWAIQEIPRHLVNDDIRRSAVKLGVRALMFINPDDTDIYMELVLMATAISNFGYIMIDDRLKTRETVEAIINHDPQHMSLEWNGQAWIKPLLTQADIDRVSAISYNFMMSVGVDNVAWSSVKKVLIDNPDRYPDLMQRGGGDLLVKVVQEGGWPAKIDGQNVYRPKGIFELASLISKTQEHEVKFPLYCACLKTFPINKVLKVMYTEQQRKILLSLYPQDVLVEHAKTNRPLRGLLLEDALGL
jgi:hypothetical protein